ncbi:non-heme iron oxygenase ferredoxin subunit [Bradyrhizobium sp. Arg62]|uniref:non-heme iron oxygenase ferredoxin subunit n=1 Tax=Bradyrhizobium brasilense TaxID=1419277 RepID=UPI001E55B09C|nr:non-heme iron oxygenase ferredoxin subunit [Bradyrhizobium brasilense]MCC8943913.1 non-heme iron oxygenase ferredoxin subunit [Bradyrhizobium brasilense]
MTITTSGILIGRVEDFPEGEIRPAAMPDGTNLAIYNVNGAIYATADLCTHGEASLSEEGILTGNIVECPWHFGTFDVTSGEPTGMPCTVPLKTFTVKLIEDGVYVQL